MQEVVEVFGKVVYDDIVKEVKVLFYFVILVDEMIDIVVLEQFILYLRYIFDKGMIKCLFLGIFEFIDCKV